MIDPAFLDELDRYGDRERRARSRRRGERREDAVGEGLTFADYRRYSPGDEPRFIDWNLYARTDELYVKQFEAERSHTVHVLLDASASMAFDDRAKFEYAAKLGLGFASLTAREYNDFQFSVFGGPAGGPGRAERLDRGRSTRGEVLALVDRCNELDPAGEADFEAALSGYVGRISSKALIVVCSDFLGDIDGIESGLDALSANELVLGHVVHPDERDLPGRGDTVFEALEGDAERRTHVGRRVADEYGERFEEHATAVEAVAERLHARHERVGTETDVFDAFGELWRA